MGGKLRHLKGEQLREHVRSVGAHYRAEVERLRSEKRERDELDRIDRENTIAIHKGDALTAAFHALGDVTGPELLPVASVADYFAGEYNRDRVYLEFNLPGFAPFCLVMEHTGSGKHDGDNFTMAQGAEHWNIRPKDRYGVAEPWVIRSGSGPARCFRSLPEVLDAAYIEPPDPAPLAVEPPATTVLPCEYSCVEYDAGNNIQLYPFAYQGALDVQKRAEGLRFAVLSAEGRELAHVTLEWGGPVDALLNAVNEWADQAEAADPDATDDDDDQGDDSVLLDGTGGE